ncbi:MAG: ADP-ribosylation factor-like protein, partial [Planctomycetales bacterium]
MRILYGGPPDTGKTTNLRHLVNLAPSDDASPLANPGPDSVCTLYFDCFHLDNLRFLGQRLRCQIISVPGQMELASRRNFLMGLADAVVFVADSRAHQAERNRQWFEEMKTALRSENTEEAPVGLVVQANMQDLPGALSPEDVLRELGLAPVVPAIPARAHVGLGVKQCFLLAFELALQRFKERFARGKINDSPAFLGEVDDLYRALLNLDHSNNDFPTAFQETVVAAESSTEIPTNGQDSAPIASLAPVEIPAPTETPAPT